ncbi:peptidoglycan editing factor PgeF [Sediminibacillus massiliensis]|uniref:peptidoglycan editing factor PgeF n=1 Tax=Sediminibacillus massiliensis TaxID=1926277 RepID=UPI000988936C|nr:peptidoglycan editing factor PgeF [Sediminibacillus massiliensis]
MAEPFQTTTDSIMLIRSWVENHPGIKAGITTRNGGFSNYPFDTFNMGLHVEDEQQTVISNREKLAEILNFPLGDWVSGQQIHETNVAVVTEEDKGKGSRKMGDALSGFDGLITNQSGILCTAFFADCVPLFFFHPSSGWMGIAHAGWRGTVNRMGEKMVCEFKNQGLDISQLLVAIGPCISQTKYEVDDRILNEIPAGLTEQVVQQVGDGRGLLDLRKTNYEIFLQSGLKKENIQVTEYCTYRDDQLFFSHRRDKGSTGRMLGFIGLEK